MKIYLIRHGMTEANEKQLYCGSTDLSLSRKGRDELNNHKKNIVIPMNSVFISSPMKRSVESLNILFDDPRIDRFVDDFREFDFGEFEGKGYEELKDNPMYLRWIGDFEMERPPKGESFASFRKRVVEGYQEIVSSYQNKADNLIVVCHGGIIRMIMSSIINKEIPFFEWQVPCGRGYIIDTITNGYKPL